MTNYHLTNEKLLDKQEYFVKSVGPIKKVEISYGPGGVSRGIATIIFSQAQGAAKAVEKLNGLLVDGRPMKVCSIISRKPQL